MGRQLARGSLAWARLFGRFRFAYVVYCWVSGMYTEGLNGNSIALCTPTSQLCDGVGFGPSAAQVDIDPLEFPGAVAGLQETSGSFAMRSPEA